MKSLNISLIVFFLFISSTCSGQKENTDTTQTDIKKTTVSVQEMKEISESDKDIFVIDVRTKPEYDNGHLSFADVLISYDSLEFYLDSLPEDKESEIYCYCRSGRRSQIATEYLLSIGYNNVFNMTGGMIAWEKADFEIVTK